MSEHMPGSRREGNTATSSARESYTVPQVTDLDAVEPRRAVQERLRAQADGGSANSAHDHSDHHDSHHKPSGPIVGTLTFFLVLMWQGIKSLPSMWEGGGGGHSKPKADHGGGGGGHH